MSLTAVARLARTLLYVLSLAATCSAVTAFAQVSVANGDARWALLEHEYAAYFMRRFPVVATYLGGAAFDAALAGIDASLRDYSPQAIKDEDAQLGRFRERFTALAPEGLSLAHRIDRSSPSPRSSSSFASTSCAAIRSARSIPTWISRSAASTGKSRG